MHGESTPEDLNKIMTALLPPVVMFGWQKKGRREPLLMHSVHNTYVVILSKEGRDEQAYIITTQANAETIL